MKLNENQLTELENLKKLILVKYDSLIDCANDLGIAGPSLHSNLNRLAVYMDKKDFTKHNNFFERMKRVGINFENVTANNIDNSNHQNMSNADIGNQYSNSEVIHPGTPMDLAKELLLGSERDKQFLREQLKIKEECIQRLLADLQNRDEALKEVRSSVMSKLDKVFESITRIEKKRK